MIDEGNAPAVMTREVTGPVLSKMPGYVMKDGYKHYGYAPRDTTTGNVWDFYTTLKLDLNTTS